MKVKIFNLLLILICIQFFASCSSDDSSVNNPETSSDLIPLKIGNEWTYLEESYGLHPWVDTVKTVILGDTIINGKKWYNLGSSFQRKNNLGVWISNGHDEFILYKYPCEEGEIFYSEPSGRIIKLESKHKSVSVTAGTFECYLYTDIDPQNNQSVFHYVCPGIGLIAREVYCSDSTGTQTFEQKLIEYIIN